jgi:soluble lytic murein transglycosylase-like protein
MEGADHIIFPGIIIGCVVVILIAGLVLSPQIVLASTPDQSPLQIADKRLQDAFTDCTLPSSYPDTVRQWCGWIVEYAGKNDLDPLLLAAIITQESGGDPQAYSASGAVGLMQVMPRDGIAAGFMCISGPCFSSRPSIEELTDPEFNIAYGAHLFAGLISQHGDIREALCSYGPHDVGYTYADAVLNIYSTYR